MRGLAVLTALALALSAAPAAADTVPSLPEPTGRQPVGSTSVYLKDTSRPDPWVPSVPYRELMVSLFYPATSSDGPGTQYVTPAESAALLAKSGIAGPPDLFAMTRTNSVRDARPAGRPHSLPLIVLVATSFPDGRLVGCASCDVHDHEGFDEKQMLSRAADVSFVLDELTGPHPKWHGADLIDRSRIGMAGHSVGGASAIAAMAGDSRIKAGMNIDGATPVPLTAPGLSRPFMFVSHQLDPATRCAPLRPDWERDWAQLTGWKRSVEVAGTVHSSFTDVGLFADQFGVDIGAIPTAERTQAITRAYVNAFFDQHLCGKPSSLLDAPSSHYPEMAFCH